MFQWGTRSSNPQKLGSLWRGRKHSDIKKETEIASSVMEFMSQTHTHTLCWAWAIFKISTKMVRKCSQTIQITPAKPYSFKRKRNDDPAPSRGTTAAFVRVPPAGAALRAGHSLSPLSLLDLSFASLSFASLSFRAHASGTHRLDVQMPGPLGHSVLWQHDQTRTHS